MKRKNILLIVSLVIVLFTLVLGAISSLQRGIKKEKMMSILSPNSVHQDALVLTGSKVY